MTTEPAKLTEPTTIVNAVAIKSKTGAGPSANSASSMVHNGCGSAPHTVEQRYELGHSSIPNPVGAENTDRRASWMAAKIGIRCLTSETTKRSRHASTAPAARSVAAAVFGEDNPLSATMKQTAAASSRAGPRWCHRSSSRRPCFSSEQGGRENITSIRSVTTTRTTILIDAKITALTQYQNRRRWSGTGHQIAPIKITPWIALAPDINGVCR